MKREMNIIFFDEYAMGKETKYAKQEIVEMIKQQRMETKKSKRSYNKKTGALNYTFFDRENRINVRIPGKYKNENKKYINFFENLCLYDKKVKKLQAGLLTIGTVTVFSAGVALSEPVSKVYETAKEFNIDLLEDPIADLEWEIKIHGGYAWTDDRKVYPEYDHGCVFENKELSVQERISTYCDKYELGETVEEAAKRKFEYYYNDNPTLAEEIELDEIYKQSKEKGNSK